MCAASSFVLFSIALFMFIGARAMSYVSVSACK
jgi:hypothetical protein